MQPAESDNAGPGPRELTYGEKAVGLTFNPGGSAEVAASKKQYADVIDSLNEFRELAKTAGNSEKIRLFSIAITEAQAAQMWAVKAITWKS